MWMPDGGRLGPHEWVPCNGSYYGSPLGSTRMDFPAEASGRELSRFVNIRLTLYSVAVNGPVDKFAVSDVYFAHVMFSSAM